MAYSRVVPLVFPITTASGKLSSIDVSTLPSKQVREISAKYDLDNDPQGFNALDREFELVTAMTRQPEDIIAQLGQPDYNSLTNQVDRLVNGSTPDLLEEDAQARREAGEKVEPIKYPVDNPPLLVPVSDPINGEITDYRLQPPTVGLTRQVRKEKDGHKQGMTVAATCSSLHPDIISQLHMPDFNHLMGRVRDFLTEQGDYFQTETLTD